jgi:type II secretory pathway pseudopilin PulG
MTVGRAGALALALLLLLTAAAGFNQLRKTKEWAEQSAFLALEQEIRTQLDLFRGTHGTYPASLQELKINYGRTDGADASMLDCFDYKGLASSYTLINKPCPSDSSK